MHGNDRVGRKLKRGWDKTTYKKLWRLNVLVKRS